MRLLGRHVSLTVLGAMFGVLFLLLGLDTVFSFIGELEDLKGRYQAVQAVMYILLQAPWRFCDMSTVAALVGAIVGLGLLANQSELTVMRAAGVGIGRIVWWVTRPALFMVALSLLAAEYVVPYCEDRAETLKLAALGEDFQSGRLQGFWQRDGETFVHIRTVYPGGRLEGVSFYDMDVSRERMSRYRYAESAAPGEKGWTLDRITRLRFLPDGRAELGAIAQTGWQTGLTPGYLRLVTVAPEYLSMTSVYRYARYLEAQGQDGGVYDLEFWKKALSPLATLSMVLIACSFIFGPLRSVTMGLRIIAGVMAGLGFRYLQDFSGFASVVYHFHPFLAALLPILACLAAGAVAITRVR